MTEESLRPSRTAYLLKFTGALMVAALGAVGGQLLQEGTGWGRWVAFGLIITACLLFALVLNIGRARDEFEDMIALKAGHYAGITTIGLIIGLHLAVDLGWVETNAVPVYALPGFYLMYTVLMSFIQRDRYAAEGE
ncbi:MAG: hypothetical protein AAGH90_04090 [Pseudomonadota bacterium]